MVHSLTKFLNGHADVVGDVIVVKDEARCAHFRKVVNQLGGVLSPFDAFLVHRGIKALALSVGIEDVDEIIADLKQALSKITEVQLKLAFAVSAAGREL